MSYRERWRRTALGMVLLVALTPVSVFAAPGDNIALMSYGGSAEVVVLAAGTAETIFDGITETRVRLQGYSGYVIRRLAEATTVDRIRVVISASSSTTHTVSISTSQDGGATWQEVGTKALGFLEDTYDLVLTAPIRDVNAVRVDVANTSKNAWPWIHEVEVYEAPPPPPPPDTTAPDAPTGVNAIPGEQRVDLTWSPSLAPDVSVYRVYRDGIQVAETSETVYADTGLVAGQMYTYTITAVDTSGNESPPSAPVTATPTAPMFPPGQPTNLVGERRERAIALRWSPPATGTATGYRVYRNGLLVATTTQTSWTDTGLTPKTTYQYGVSAVNSAGESPQVTLEITTLPAGSLDGVQSNMAGLGPNIMGGLGLLLPFAVLAAGLTLASMILSRGLTWLASRRSAGR